MKYQIVSIATPAAEPTVKVKLETGPDGSLRLLAKGPDGTDWAALLAILPTGTVRRFGSAGATCYGLSGLLEFDSIGRIRDVS